MQEPYLTYIEGAITPDKDWIERDSLVPFIKKCEVRLRLYYYDRSSKMGQVFGKGRSEVVLMICHLKGRVISVTTSCTSGPTEFYNPRKTDDEDEKRHSWQDMIFTALNLDIEYGNMPDEFKALKALEYVDSMEFTEGEMGTRAYIGVLQDDGDVKVAVLQYDGMSVREQLKEHFSTKERALELVESGELRSIDEDGTFDAYPDAWPSEVMSRLKFDNLRDASCSYLWSGGGWVMKKF